ncbi:MAG: SDR family oxidoreductase [Acidimicrobiales bacterium]
MAGASAGLGLETAKALAADGVLVAICGRDRARIDAAAAEVNRHAASHGHDEIEAVAVVADISSEAGAHSFVSAATDALGGVDILVLNGGGPPPGNFKRTTFEGYKHAIDLNLLSGIAMCQAAVPAMCEAGWGRVVAVTSHIVRQPSPFLITSATARAGLTGFLRALSNEVGPKGVTVNCAQPGVHATDRMRQLGANVEAITAQIPTRAVGRPEDFGNVVAFLCSDHARFITGASLIVDGGQYQGLL